jgi:hypothetical protein
MRLGIIGAVIVVAMSIASPVLAVFPDLPGMGAAEDATKGELGRVEVEDEPTTSSGAGGMTSSGGVTPAVRSTVKPEQAETIRSLPGGDSVPMFGDAGLASTTRSGLGDTDGMPRGLTALAALGTLVSVGAFLFFRNRLIDGAQAK